MNENDLEKLMDRVLKNLPLPEAPPTLLPRVVAAVEIRLQRPRYRWVWSNWPPGLRLISAGVMGVVLVGVAFLEPLAQGALGGVLSTVVEPVMRITGGIRAVFGAVEALRRALLEPFFGYFVVLGILMGTACAAVGAALTRMASLGGGSR